MSALIVIGILGAVATGLYFMVQNSQSPTGGTSGATPPAGDSPQSAAPAPGSSLDAKIDALARAIALAEGANIAGSVPQRYGNPGDLSVGDDYFGTATGSTVTPDGERILMFAPGSSWDSGDGWDALREKVRRMLSGESVAYPLTASFTQVAQRYAGDWQSWVANVTARLGVTPDTTLEQYAQS